MSADSLLQRLRSLLGGRARRAGATPGEERNRRLALSSAASVGGKTMAMAVSLVSVPLSLGYLDHERYGLWLSLATTIAVLGFADLGVGNALLNLLSAAYGKGDRDGARRDFWSAALVLSLVSTLLGVAFAVAYPQVDWGRAFNVQSQIALAEVGPSVAITVACFLIGLPLGLAQTVRNAYQEGYINVAWNSAASIASLVALVVAIQLHAPLQILVLTSSGIPLLGNLVSLLSMLGRTRPWLRPRPEDLSWRRGAKIVRGGFVFLVLQLTVAMGFNIDNLVVAQLLGADAVVTYGLGARLFILAGALVGMFLAPLWPAYAEAFASGDLPWIKSTLRRSLLATGLSTGLAAPLLVGLGPWLLRVWTRTDLHVPRGLLVAFASWMILSAIGGAAGMILNARGIVRLQIATASSLLITMVSLKILLGQRFGMEGVAWASSLAYVATTVLPTSIVIRRLLKELSDQSKSSVPADGPIDDPLASTVRNINFPVIPG